MVCKSNRNQLLKGRISQKQMMLIYNIIPVEGKKEIKDGRMT